jgi:hypothetical protein
MSLVDRVLQFMFGTKAPRQAPEPHALDALCARYACTYERSVFQTGEVQIRLLRPDATIGAVGATTAEAVEKLTAKVHACWSGL